MEIKTTNIIMSVEVNIKYKIYELNNIMGNSSYKSLSPVQANGYSSNEFDTEEEAIQELIDNKKFHEDYIILKQVYITNY